MNSFLVSILFLYLFCNVHGDQDPSSKNMDNPRLSRRTLSIISYDPLLRHHYINHFIGIVKLAMRKNVNWKSVALVNHDPSSPFIPVTESDTIFESLLMDLSCLMHSKDSLKIEDIVQNASFRKKWPSSDSKSDSIHHAASDFVLNPSRGYIEPSNTLLIRNQFETNWPLVTMIVDSLKAYVLNRHFFRGILRSFSILQGRWTLYFTSKAASWLVHKVVETCQIHPTPNCLSQGMEYKRLFEAELHDIDEFLYLFHALNSYSATSQMEFKNLQSYFDLLSSKRSWLKSLWYTRVVSKVHDMKEWYIDKFESGYKRYKWNLYEKLKEIKRTVSESTADSLIQNHKALVTQSLQNLKASKGMTKSLLDRQLSLTRIKKEDYTILLRLFDGFIDAKMDHAKSYLTDLQDRATVKRLGFKFMAYLDKMDRFHSDSIYRNKILELMDSHRFAIDSLKNKIQEDLNAILSSSLPLPPIIPSMNRIQKQILEYLCAAHVMNYAKNQKDGATLHHPSLFIAYFWMKEVYESISTASKENAK